MLPFTTEHFFSVFERYNLAVYPAQYGLFGLALAAVFLSVRPRQDAGRIVSGILAVLWLWMGAVYHIAFFSEINPAAYLFGTLSILQAVIFIYVGVIRQAMEFEFETNFYGWAGAAAIVYALAVYPVLGMVIGHQFPRAPTFGVPCPTAIFTFGMLLFLRRRPPLFVLVIPVLWSLIGSSASVLLGVREDVGLLVAGIGGGVLILFKNKDR